LSKHILDSFSGSYAARTHLYERKEQDDSPDEGKHGSVQPNSPEVILIQY